MVKNNEIHDLKGRRNIASG